MPRHVGVAMMRPGGTESQQDALWPAVEMLTRYVADLGLTQYTGRVSIMSIIVSRIPSEVPEGSASSGN
jgi:hypothetical protein